MIEEDILKLVKESDPSNPIQFVHNIVKPYAIEKLNQYILDCNDCGICNSVKTITNGNPNASIVIIGESSTLDQQDDVNQNAVYPFNNESGSILHSVLNKLKVNKDEVFFINSVNCFPHRTDGINIVKRSPTKTERTNCKTFLDYALKTVEPLLVICLGSVATNGINEEIGKQSISKIRGSYFMYRGINVMPTYHPGYFLELEKSGKFDEEYVDNLRWDFFNDLEKSFIDLNEQYPELNIIEGEA